MKKPTSLGPYRIPTHVLRITVETADKVQHSGSLRFTTEKQARDAQTCLAKGGRLLGYAGIAVVVADVVPYVFTEERAE